MRPTPRIFANAVTVRRAAWTNSRGTRTPSYTDVPMRASVQPAKGSRYPDHLRATGVTLYDVLFPSDPGVKADDQVVWGAKTLSVLSSANDQAGRGLMWVVTCREGE